MIQLDSVPLNTSEMVLPLSLIFYGGFIHPHGVSITFHEGLHKLQLWHTLHYLHICVHHCWGDTQPYRSTCNFPLCCGSCVGILHCCFYIHQCLNENWKLIIHKWPDLSISIYLSKWIHCPDIQHCSSRYSEGCMTKSPGWGSEHGKRSHSLV